MSVEDIRLNDLAISFTDSDAFRALELADVPAMLLGMDALSLFDRLEIDYVNHRIVFDPPEIGAARSAVRLAAKATNRAASR